MCSDREKQDAEVVGEPQRRVGGQVVMRIYQSRKRVAAGEGLEVRMELAIDSTARLGRLDGRDPRIRDANRKTISGLWT